MQEGKEEMLKGYICGWERSKDPKRPYHTDFWFGSDVKKAAYWLTRREAENDCVMFDNHRIVIASSEGGTHICGGFRVEELTPDRFVIFCEAPFILKQGSAKPLK